ncbi:putative aspartic proteinase yapsin-6 [Clavispora lusitaniae]|nr:putative aspartic proteinase yapsin-6 [Clavispora lusitaniae]QFZ52421.1 putative aspartic proteinase yapsin-6 [Clavispora lusitaniae]
MRTAFLFLVAVVAANLNVANSRRFSLLERDDPQEISKGFSFGSPPKSILTYASFDAGVIDIPPVMLTTNFENVTLLPLGQRNLSFDYFNSSSLGNQTAWLNGYELSNFSFTSPNPDMRFQPHYVTYGLSIVRDESFFETYSSPNPVFTIIDSLYGSGYIETRSFSYVVNSTDDVSFGKIDHGKYDGPLKKFKNYDPWSQDDAGFTHPTLLLDGIAGNNFSAYHPIPVRITDNTWQLPDSLYYPLFDHFQRTYGMNDDGILPCSVFNSTEYISFYFSGEEYRVQAGNFIGLSNNPYNNDSTIYFDTINTYGPPIIVPNENSTCTFSPIQIDMFNTGISAALFLDQYVVVDYDNMEIAIAPTATKSKPQTIEIISTGIPSATPAKYFTYSEVYYSCSTPDLVGEREVYSTWYHPSYSFYTGERYGPSATESFYSTQTSSAPVTSAEPTSTNTGESTNHSTKTGSSSSSKAAGNTQTVGGVFAFITCFLSALMMF